MPLGECQALGRLGWTEEEHLDPRNTLDLVMEYELSLYALESSSCTLLFLNEQT